MATPWPKSAAEAVLVSFEGPSLQHIKAKLPTFPRHHWYQRHQRAPSLFTIFPAPTLHSRPASKAAHFQALVSLVVGLGQTFAPPPFPRLFQLIPASAMAPSANSQDRPTHPNQSGLADGISARTQSFSHFQPDSFSQLQHRTRMALH